MVCRFAWLITGCPIEVAGSTLTLLVDLGWLRNISMMPLARTVSRSKTTYGCAVFDLDTVRASGIIEMLRNQPRSTNNVKVLPATSIGQPVINQAKRQTIPDDEDAF